MSKPPFYSRCFSNSILAKMNHETGFFSTKFFIRPGLSTIDSTPRILDEESDGVLLGPAS